MKRHFNLWLVLVVAVGLAAGAALAAFQPTLALGKQSAGKTNGPAAMQGQAGAEGTATQGSGAAESSGQASGGSRSSSGQGQGGAQGSSQSGTGAQGVGQSGAMGQGRGVFGQGTQAQSGQEGRSSSVIGSVVSVDGDVLTVNTQQGEVKVKLSHAKIQKTVAGTADDLKAGERIVVSGQQGTDGSYTASSIQIGPPAEASSQATPQPTAAPK